MGREVAGRSVGGRAVGGQAGDVGGELMRAVEHLVEGHLPAGVGGQRRHPARRFRHAGLDLISVRLNRDRLSRISRPTPSPPGPISWFRPGCGWDWCAFSMLNAQMDYRRTQHARNTSNFGALRYVTLMSQTRIFLGQFSYKSELDP